MTITVRPIELGEGALLLEMVKALADDHGFTDKMRSSPADREAALFAPHPIVGCLLAFLEGNPAGCAVSSNDAGRTLYREIGAELEDNLTFCRLADDALMRLAAETS